MHLGETLGDRVPEAVVHGQRVNERDVPCSARIAEVVDDIRTIGCPGFLEAISHGFSPMHHSQVWDDAYSPATSL